MISPHPLLHVVHVHDELVHRGTDLEHRRHELVDPYRALDEDGSCLGEGSLEGTGEVLKGLRARCLGTHAAGNGAEVCSLVGKRRLGVALVPEERLHLSHHAQGPVVQEHDRDRNVMVGGCDGLRHVHRKGAIARNENRAAPGAESGADCGAEAEAHGPQAS